MIYELRFKSIFHGVVDIVSLIDIDHNILMVNKAYEDILGKSDAECIGQKCYSLIRHRENPCPDCPILIRSEAHKDAQITIPIGDEKVLIRRHPVYDNIGKIVGVIEIGRIITTQLQMEQELEHQGRLKIMGELAASIAHEIKNPLIGIGLMIVSILERLKEKGEKDEIYHDLKDILREIQRLEKLLESLRDFGKPENFTTEYEEIQPTIETALKILNGKLRNSGIIIEKKRNQDLPKIKINNSKMQQVFLNLLLNSIEAMPQGGTITITSEMSKKEIRGSQKSFLHIIVQDTGEGIKKEDLPYIFEPFFSKSSKKSGLGLSIVLRIIELHNGFIELKSTEKKGTTVDIYLPVN